MILAFAGQKGGIGKTTLALNVGAELARSGRTLLVDADPQSSLTRMTGASISDETLATVIGQSAPGTGRTADAVVCVDENLDLLPSEPLLAQTELGLVLRLNRERQLALALRKVADLYDYIVIDSPPSLGLLTINILLAADWVIVPTLLEAESVQGLNLFSQTVNETRSVYEDSARILGVAACMVDLWKEGEPRLVVSRDLWQALRERKDTPLFPTLVPRAAAFSEAALLHRTIQDYAPDSAAAAAIHQLTNDIKRAIHGQTKKELR